MTTPTLVINQELLDLLPPLSSEEFAGLEADILKNGCLSPLVAWNGILIDGHHRYEICKKHKIEFDVQNVNFDDINDVKIWIWEHQEGRRNLTNYQRSVIALKMKPVLEEKAKQNQKQSQGRGKKGLSTLTNLNTQTSLAKKARVAAGTLHKVEFLEKHASEETKQKLCAEKTTINKEYNRLKAEIDAKQPAKAKKAKSSTKAKTTSTQTASEEPKYASTQSTFFESEDAVEEGELPKIVTVSLKSGPKVKDTYYCDVQFEPDPNDKAFEWLTDEQRTELHAMQEGCPNTLVPQIHKFTIQGIPEHCPAQLIKCLYSLFKPFYREKLAFALLRKMNETDADREGAHKVVTTLFHEFQNH